MTGRTKAELEGQIQVATVCLYESLADTIASHDVYERRYGVGTQVREEGEISGLRHALFMVGAGDWAEIDAEAARLWPKAMTKFAATLGRCIDEATEPVQAARLARTRDIARQLLAEHEAERVAS